jgi:hypothetical protein
LPPPPASREDAPHSVEVPPLEPPPRSLEAMVKSGPRKRTMRAKSGDALLWFLLLLLFVLGVTLTLYFKG